jgi:hypothetical protein
MCRSGEPKDVPELWERYKQGMSEDFIGCYSEETVCLYAPAEINEMVKNYCLSLHKLHLPAPEMLTAPLHSQSFNILEEQAKQTTNTEKIKQ